MKKLHFIAALALSAIFFTGCGNNSTGSSTGTDSTARTTDSSPATIPPPDNSNATNPSLADTAFSKKDSTNKDSSKMKR